MKNGRLFSLLYLDLDNNKLPKKENLSFFLLKKAKKRREGLKYGINCCHAMFTVQKEIGVWYTIFNRGLNW